jgi:hypothetical protein
MKNFIEKLKQRWGVKSNWQLVIICVVFALTGMSAVQLRKLVFPLLGVNESTPFWQLIIIWLLIIFPFYYVFLLFYGFIFGQFPFFYGMVKKTLGRFRRVKQKDSQ